MCKKSAFFKKCIKKEHLFFKVLQKYGGFDLVLRLKMGAITPW